MTDQTDRTDSALDDIAGTLRRIHAAEQRADRVLNRGIDERGDYIPIEDDPTVPPEELDEWGRSTTDTATARIRADYRPRRRVWPWRLALVGFLLIAVAFVALSVYTVATAAPTPGPTWNGEF